MRDFSIQVEIAATPARVWDVMSDGEHWAEWTPSVTSVEIFDKPLRVGSRALIKQPKLPPGRFKVTALDPGRSFTWGSGIPGVVYCHAHHSVEPSPVGTRARLALHFSGLLGGIMAGRMADLINEYLAMEAAGLKRYCEEGPRDPSTPLSVWSAEAVKRLETAKG
jgi:carbon monoxide dehydrogenase subunit G